MPRPTSRPTSRVGSSDGRDEVDFLVRAVGPGWVEIEEDGVRWVPVGEVSPRTTRSSGSTRPTGRTATFTWQR